MALNDARDADVDAHAILDQHVDNSLFVLLVLDRKLFKTYTLLTAVVIFIHFRFQLHINKILTRQKFSLPSEYELQNLIPAGACTR